MMSAENKYIDKKVNSQDEAFHNEIVIIENHTGTPTPFKHEGRRNGKTASLLQEITGKYNAARRAVHIAAVIMEQDGLCRYESHRECRRVWPPSSEDCVKCIENWLLARARKELKNA